MSDPSGTSLHTQYWSSCFHMMVDPGLNLTFTSVSFNPPLTFAKTVLVLQTVSYMTGPWMIPSALSCSVSYVFQPNQISNRTYINTVFGFFCPVITVFRALMRREVRKRQYDEKHHWLFMTHIITTVSFRCDAGSLKSRFALMKCFHRCLVWSWSASSRVRCCPRM